MFKFELEQKIFYLKDNRIHSAEITSRHIVENSKDNWTATQAQKDLWTPWGQSEIAYFTCHGKVLERKAFASARELAESLIEAGEGQT